MIDEFSPIIFNGGEHRLVITLRNKNIGKIENKLNIM